MGYDRSSVDRQLAGGGKDGISVPSLESRTPGHNRFIKVIGLSEIHKKCIHKEGKSKKEKKGPEERTQQLKFPLLQHELCPQAETKLILLCSSQVLQTITDLLHGAESFLRS
jgi:hypothetical protein